MATWKLQSGVWLRSKENETSAAMWVHMDLEGLYCTVLQCFDTVGWTWGADACL